VDVEDALRADDKTGRGEDHVAVPPDLARLLWTSVIERQQAVSRDHELAGRAQDGDRGGRRRGAEQGGEHDGRERPTGERSNDTRESHRRSHSLVGWPGTPEVGRGLPRAAVATFGADRVRVESGAGGPRHGSPNYTVAPGSPVAWDSHHDRGLHVFVGRHASGWR